MNLPDLNDVRRDVEKIRRVVSGGESIAKEDLRRLQRDFEDSVSRVNEELLACEALIDDNNASLAVQRAERTSILELVAALDFSDREAWVDFVEERQLPCPPKPFSSTARRLGRAIGPARQREPLLRTIRWHALAGSPLSVRLDAMWRMREVDETPEIWERDIQSFESERLKQIADELEDADTAADVRHLRALLNELRDKRWLIAPPDDLIQDTTKRLSRHRATAARQRIPTVLEELRNAESAGSDAIPEGRRLRGQLERLLPAAQLKPDSELAAECRLAVAWLERIDQQEETEADYQRLVDDLESSLNRNAERDVLETLQHQLKRFPDGVPDHLAGQLTTQLARKDTEDTRRHYVRLVGAITAVLAVVVLLFVFFSSRSLRLELEGHEERLGRLIERQDLEAAQKYITTLQEQSAESAAHPPIAALITRHNELTEFETERQSRLATGIEDLRTSIADGSTIEEMDKLESTLTKLAADTDGSAAEDDAIAALRTTLDDQRFAVQASVDDRFAQAAEALSQRRDLVDRRDVEGLRKLLTDYRSLMQRPHVSDEMTRPVQKIVLDVDNRLTRAVEMDDQDRLARSVTQASGDLALFHTKLTDYASRYPTDPRSIDFERVARDEATTWNQVEQQNDFIRKWSALTPESLSPKQAKSLMAEADALFAKRDDLRQDKEIRRLVDYVRSVAARRNEFGADIAVEEMTRHFESTDWYSELYMVLVQNDDSEFERYYSDVLPRPDGSKWKINAALSEFQLGSDLNTNTKEFETADINMPSSNPTRDEWLAPHVTFARDTDRKLREMTDATWEKTLLGLLEDLNRKEPGTDDVHRMEPIARYDLTLMTLEILSDGSSLAKDYFADYVVQLKRLPGETRHNVFDPADRIARQMRPEIRDVLQRAPKFAEARAEILSQRATLFETELGDLYRWVGWLRRDESGTWSCDAPRQPPQSLTGDLWTAIPVDDGVRFLQVGHVAEGSYVIDVSPVDFAQGRPIYVNVSVEP